MLLTSQGSAGVSPLALALFLREDEQLVGATNGANITFLIPDSKKALNQEPGVKVKVYYNGQRLHEGGVNDFIVIESGGAGTGFDTVLLSFPPLSGDLVSADYIIVNP